MISPQQSIGLGGAPGVLEVHEVPSTEGKNKVCSWIGYRRLFIQLLGVYGI